MSGFYDFYRSYIYNSITVILWKNIINIKFNKVSDSKFLAIISYTNSFIIHTCTHISIEWF